MKLRVVSEEELLNDRIIQVRITPLDLKEVYRLVHVVHRTDIRLVIPHGKTSQELMILIRLVPNP